MNEKRVITVLQLPAGAYEANVAQIEDELQIYQEYVGGNIEIVRLNDRTALVVNDEGLIRELEENPVATVLYWQRCGRPVTPICGNAWVVGLRSEDGEFTNVTPSAVFMVNFITVGFKALNDDTPEQ